MVRRLGSLTNTTGSRNWFQVHRNSRMVSDMIAGRASGT